MIDGTTLAPNNDSFCVENVSPQCKDLLRSLQELCSGRFYVDKPKQAAMIMTKEKAEAKFALDALVANLSPSALHRLVEFLHSDTLALLLSPSTPAEASTNTAGAAIAALSSSAATGIVAERFVHEQIAVVVQRVGQCQRSTSRACSTHRCCRQVMDGDDSQSSIVAHARWLNGDGEASASHDIVVDFVSPTRHSLLVEVKGTTNRPVVELSASQVDAARANGERYVLVVVAGDERQMHIIANPIEQWIDGKLRCDWLVRF